MFKRNFLWVFLPVPLPLILPLTLRRVWFCYLGFTHHSFLVMDKIPLRDLFSRLSSLSPLDLSLSEMLQSLGHHCPYPGMLISILCWRVQSWAQHSRCVSSQLRKGEGSPPTCWLWKHSAAQGAAALLCCKSIVLAHGNHPFQFCVPLSRLLEKFWSSTDPCGTGYLPQKLCAADCSPLSPAVHSVLNPSPYPHKKSIEFVSETKAFLKPR